MYIADALSCAYLFSGEQLVVPLSLCKGMLWQLHSSHIGIGGSIRRALKMLFWPRLSAEIRDFVSRCTICPTYRLEQAREELQPRALPSRPRQKIAPDLFVLGKHSFLIMVDSWSNFSEVVEIHKKTAQAVITQRRVQFARHGMRYWLRIMIQNSTIRSSRISNPNGSLSIERLVQSVEWKSGRCRKKPTNDCS